MSDGSVDAVRLWKKSSFSGDAQCVEIRRIRGVVQVRNSRHPSGPVLEFTGPEWRAFLAGVVAGEFSLPK